MKTPFHHNNFINQAMKKTLFAILLIPLFATFQASAFTVTANNPEDLKVVVSGKKIWFIADEIPVKHLCIKVTNNKNEVVLEKCLSSKVVDWSLNLDSLKKGDYTLHIGKDRTLKFTH